MQKQKQISLSTLVVYALGVILLIDYFFGLKHQKIINSLQIGQIWITPKLRK